MSKHDELCIKAMNILTYDTVTMDYTNWRGEFGKRRIKPLRIEYASTSWHPEKQHLLVALDLDKKAERSFAVKDIGEWYGFTKAADAIESKSQYSLE